MPTMKLRPVRPDLVLRDPVTGAALAPDGTVVPRNAYWLRRLRDGDAVEVAAGRRRPAAKADTAAEG